MTKTRDLASPTPAPLPAATPDGVLPLLDRAGSQMSTLAHDSMEAVRHGSRQLRDSASHASQQTVDYIRREPVKSVLMAAAAGAALMALFNFAMQRREPR